MFIVCRTAPSPRTSTLSPWPPAPASTTTSAPRGDFCSTCCCDRLVWICYTYVTCKHSAMTTDNIYSYPRSSIYYPCSSRSCTIFTAGRTAPPPPSPFRTPTSRLSIAPATKGRNLWGYRGRGLIIYVIVCPGLEGVSCSELSCALVKRPCESR